MAFQDLIRYGAVRAAASGNQSLGSAAEEGFAKGEKRVQDLQDRDIEAKERSYIESERARIASEREQKEADAEYGSTNVPPSGNKSIDESKRAVVDEWKKEFAAAKAAKNSGDITADEFAQIKGDSFAKIDNFKKGQEALGTFTQMYQKALDEDQVSSSTPADIRLLGNALISGEGVSIENIDGRPTVVGVDASGKEITMDLGEIASGNAPLRFNQKVDHQGMVDTVAKQLEAYKTTLATSTGAALGNIGWEQIQEKAAHEIDQLLDNSSTVQALAGDVLGYNSEEIKDIGPEELKNQVGDYLLLQTQEEYFPVQNETRYKDPNAGAGGSNAGNASLGKLYDSRLQTAQINAAIDSGKLEDLNGLQGFEVERSDDFFGSGYSYKITDSKGNKQKLSPEAAAKFLRNSLTGTPQGGGQEPDPLGIL